MNIQAEKFKLEMTYDEVWNTAFDIRRAIEASLKDHWVNHQGAWKINEKEKLYRLEKLFLAVGRPDLYEEIFKAANVIFDKFNALKVTEQC